MSLLDNPFAAVFGKKKAAPVPKALPAAAAVPAGGDQLVGWLQQAGFKGEALKTAWAIAKRESGGRPTAHNPEVATGDNSYGLFQINMLGNLGPSRRASYGLKANEDLFDPATNARVAYAMSKGGKDFGAWGIGPNAYRKMPALNFSGFPGASAAPAAAALPALQPGKASPSPRRSMASFFLSDDDDSDNPFASLFKTQENRGQTAQARPVPGTGQGEKLAPMKLPAGTVNTTTYSGHGSHITDGLDLNAGQKTAVDIMAHPGTAVAAPASGTVLRLGSAQGGDSMYFKDDNGYVWWLGHIDSKYSLPAGTRVRAGQTLSRISADHAAPHLHLDRTLSPTNRFG